MDETLAIFSACTLLMVVVSGYLLTVFEPYYAYKRKSDDAVKLIDYHATDHKLHLIAETWAAKLSNPPTRWYEDENERSRVLKESLMEALVRHRFLFGDDPKKIEFGPNVSPIIKRALVKTGFQPGSEDTGTMLVSPSLVKMDDGTVIWRGRPMEYKSRFCDFYPEP